MTHDTLKLSIIAMGCALFGLAWATTLPQPRVAGFVVPEINAQKSPEPIYTETFASKGITAEAHSATAYTHGDKITAFWYGGTEEGASDVSVYSATCREGAWGDPRVIMDAATAQRQLGRFVRKVGNPVIYNHGNGKLWLFFVSVSVGGWAGSAINLMESADGGRTWSAARRLVTSPFLNIGTLVKNPAFEYTDGTIGLPVYHEFIGKFGELLRLNREGRIIARTRLSTGRRSLQPNIVPVTPRVALGYLRYAGENGNVLFIATEDAGLTWSEPRELDVPNPNSPVSSLQTDEHTLLVLNNAPEGRHDLSLGVSRNGEDWRIVHELESVDVDPASHDFEFSYPWFMRSRDGRFHLLYTWNKRFIKHISFNQAWLEEKIK